jgi:hypothetical protein
MYIYIYAYKDVNMYIHMYIHIYVHLSIHINTQMSYRLNSITEETRINEENVRMIEALLRQSQDKIGDYYIFICMLLIYMYINECKFIHISVYILI